MAGRPPRAHAFHAAACYKSPGIQCEIFAMNRRDAIVSMLATASTVFAPNVVRAQAFPSRTIRIVVPVSPGGGVDTFARLIAAKVKVLRDVSFIVENRTGGNSTIGGLEVQRAAPDGYTVLFHATSHAVARLVLRNAPYDPVTDFTPIALAGNAPLVHIIANKRPERTLAEIVASAKKNPNEWSFATAQLGAPGHLAAVAFNQYNGINLPIVVYRGTAPASNDVAGGHVPMMIEAIIALLPMVRAGTVRAVAVTSAKRSSLAPEIPTMAEAGLPALNFGAWWGMWGPPALPAELALTINGWVNEAVKALAAEGRLAALGIEPAQETPQAFAKVIAADVERSAKLLKAANFKPE
jgi:tripartite-type tricarboxylate transporter receptor subunit TctC